MNEATIDVGTASWPLRIPADKLIGLARPAVEARSVAEIVLKACQHPQGLSAPFSAALTPGDTVAIAVDDGIPEFVEVLSALLREFTANGIALADVTILTPPGDDSPEWIEELPDDLADAVVEVHKPDDRNALSYLSNTKAGERIEFNRRLVDADLAVVLGGRRYDPNLADACGGAEFQLAAHYGSAAMNAAWAKMLADGAEEEVLLDHARELLWPLGLPWYVQAFAGPNGTLGDIQIALPSATDRSIERQDNLWHWLADAEADLVVAAIGGPSDRIDFADFARAASIARPLVAPGGRLVLLSEAAPVIAGTLARFRDAESAAELAGVLAKHPAEGSWLAELQWCLALSKGPLLLHAGWPDDDIETLFAVPLASAAELQRLVDSAASVLIVPDAHLASVSVRP